MIIKPGARERFDPEDLYDYLNKQQFEDSFYIMHNMYVHDPFDKAKVVAAFEETHKFLKYPNRGKAHRHEIISFKRHPNVSINRYKEIAYDVATRFIAGRAPDNVWYGRFEVSPNKDGSLNCHAHLFGSPNAAGCELRHKFSPGMLNRLRVNLEKYVQQTYPELELPNLYQKIKKTKKRTISDKEYQYTKRTRRKSTTQILTESLTNIFQQVKSSQELDQALVKEGMKLYTRGKIVGVKFGRNYRLRTLGLEESYQVLLLKFERIEKTAQEIERLKRKQERSLQRTT